jgi:hypothetical protein
MLARLYIKPALGTVPVGKLTAQMLEGFYADCGGAACDAMADRSSNIGSTATMIAVRCATGTRLAARPPAVTSTTTAPSRGAP